MRALVVGRNSIEVSHAMYEIAGPCSWAYRPEHVKRVDLRKHRVVYACAPEQLPREMRRALGWVH